jgi:hypothetical protein
MWPGGHIPRVPLCGTAFRLHKTMDEDQDYIHREQGDFISETFFTRRAADFVSGLLLWMAVLHMNGLPPVTATVVPDV